MAEKIIAIFDTAREAVAAVDKLQREGVPRSDLTMMSSEPIHINALKADKESRSRIGLFAIGGAIIGAALGYMLTVWTSERVNLNTGGMPIVTPWAFGIIVYELTAFGAILASLGRTIYEARLLRRGALTDYDAAVADGRVVLLVECATDAGMETAKRLLADKIVTRE